MNSLPIFVLIFCAVFVVVMFIYSGTTSSDSDSTTEGTTRLESNVEGFNRNSSESIGERECRRVLEKLFKKQFIKKRPDFLKNTVTGSNLELDCYNEELKIACEYNGRQHASYVPIFHKNKEAYYNQKYRDLMKKQLCAQNGVFLIEVPHNVSVDKIEGFIINELKKHNRFYK